MVPAHEVWWQSLTPLMAEIRATIGPDTPTYLSFDIDGIDPAYAGGTGTPEVGGLSVPQALEIVRGSSLRHQRQHRPARRQPAV